MVETPQTHSERPHHTSEAAGTKRTAADRAAVEEDTAVLIQRAILRTGIQTEHQLMKKEQRKEQEYQKD